MIALGAHVRVVSLLVACGSAWAAEFVDPSTLNGKVLLGYQGWFRCPGGGTMGTNWSHWANGTPTAASLVIDMYPDLREFDADEVCAVPNMTIGGGPAYLFSSGNSKTVARHFRWMQQYGLDGVLVQRFLTDIPGNKSAGDVVLRNVMAAAAQYGRAFAIEYDISGANPATVVNDLQQDWNYLVNTLKVTSAPNYLRHSGKPVVSVWGLGFTGNHPPDDPTVALQIVKWFQTTAGVTYMGGTPSYWRALSNDARTDPRWSSVYQAMDLIQPWTVGRYNNTAGVDRWKTNQIQPDITQTSRNQQLYMPVIFPGFSWYNLQNTTQNAPQNQIPRLKGEFLWRQAYNAREAGAQMLKIAMFDEVNEATAMFKIATRRQDAPGQGYWLTLDADGFLLPSDWYLRLAGEISRIFHGQSPLSSTLPANPGPPWPGDDGKLSLTVLSSASFGKAALAPEAIATATGAGLSEATEAASAVPPPLSLAGTQLTVIDSTGLAKLAPLFYASPGQVNFQVPLGTALGAAALLVTNGGGTVASGGGTVASIAPGIFSAGASGQGVAAAFATIIRADGTRNSTQVFACQGAGKCSSVPIDLGGSGDQMVLELYGTGIRGRSLLSNVSCTVGGITAAVLFGGSQGGFPGLDQVNVLLPRTLVGAGEVFVNLKVDDIEANGVTVNIR